jgi:hypothetical protein
MGRQDGLFDSNEQQGGAQLPIIERDPWRLQYFEGVECPDDVVIPTDDEHAYELCPEHRWVYNKLLICETQGLPCGPHGVPPSVFPVFSKPIYNMSGMGVGGRVIRSEVDLARHLSPGHMWLALLEGEHVSSDVVVVDGEPRWWRHTVGIGLDGGTFDYWTVLAGARPALEAYCGAWLRKHLRGYTGAVNMEAIGGRLIEVHLRFADQWPDLYGRGWLPAIVDLYGHGRWQYGDGDRRAGYSVVLFGDHGVRFTPPPRSLLQTLRAEPEISSVQVTFHPELAPELHAMPPGGFRLAIVNCWNLDAGLWARERLRRAFGMVPQHESARWGGKMLRKAG